MAELIGSQQLLSQTKDATLYGNLVGDATAADWIGFIVSQTAGVEAGIAAKAAVLAGTFSVSTEQVAAQTKSLTEAQATTNIAGEPTTTITIDGEEYDISSILASTVYYWSSPGKNAATHLREVHTDVGTTPPEGFDPDWDTPAEENNAPIATPIVDTADETLSEYVSHVIQNTEPDLKNIDLTGGATDPDGDTLNVVGTPVVAVVDGNNDPVDYSGFLSISGNTLTIDQNSRDLDKLKDGESYTATVTYTLDDGNGGQVETSATITINGSLDEYKDSAGGSVSNVHEKTGSGSGQQFNDQTLLVNLADPDGDHPDDAFGFENFAGTITATQSGLTASNQSANVSDRDSDDWDNALVGDSLGMTGTTVSDSETLLAGALTDGEVTYNGNFSGNAPVGAEVTVTVNYTYDYYYLA
jgi:VCBS repeat-containing protein